jgi:histidine triad (HIT) family protein
MSDCLFCKIINGDIPASKLYEDDDVLAFWDIAPQAPKHFLVIPKKHISGINKAEEADQQLLGKLMTIAARLAQEEGIGENFRAVVNTGEEAGQTVFHIHMHVLGGRSMQWPPG